MRHSDISNQLERIDQWMAQNDPEMVDEFLDQDDTSFHMSAASQQKMAKRKRKRNHVHHRQKKSQQQTQHSRSNQGQLPDDKHNQYGADPQLSTSYPQNVRSQESLSQHAQTGHRDHEQSSKYKHRHHQADRGNENAVSSKRKRDLEDKIAVAQPSEKRRRYHGPPSRVEEADITIRLRKSIYHQDRCRRRR